MATARIAISAGIAAPDVPASCSLSCDGEALRTAPAAIAGCDRKRPAAARQAKALLIGFMMISVLRPKRVPATRRTPMISRQAILFRPPGQAALDGR
jgi:hypothetical protein